MNTKLLVATVALGDPDVVPAGMYARESLQTLELWDVLAAKLIYGENVRQVLAWVERGEVDAGFVYATDVQSSSDVRIVEQVPADTYSPIRYPVAVVRSSHLPQQAQAFIDFLSSPDVQEILMRYGFGIPGEEGA